MTDLKPALLSLLSALPATVSCAWPLEEFALPVVTLAEESSAVAAQADGQPYLEEYVFSLQILAETRQEADALSLRADALLSSLGLRRTAGQDLFDETARAYQKSLTYRALLHNDIVYAS